MWKQLLILCLLAFSVTLSAQTTEDDARDDLDYYNSANDRDRLEQRGDRFVDQLWYGAGAQLGFQSNQFSSFFQVGLSPIVGYKVNNFLSFGPRGSLVYNAFRQDIGNGDRVKSNFVTWQAGLFTRAMVFRPIFVHLEYSLVNEAVDILANGDAIKQTRAIPFLGGGYSQGGGIGQAGFELLILFRLSQPDRIGDAPFEIRSGLNFNF